MIFLNINFNQVSKCIIMIRNFIGNILNKLHQRFKSMNYEYIIAQYF